MPLPSASICDVASRPYSSSDFFVVNRKWHYSQPLNPRGPAPSDHGRIPIIIWLNCGRNHGANHDRDQAKFRSKSVRDLVGL